MDFEEYARGRLPTLLRAARAVCADSVLAEDVVQEVLIKVYAQWTKTGTFDRPDAYLRRMVINEHLSWRRKWGRLIPHADPSRLTAPRNRGGTASETERSDDRAGLIAEITRLPSRQRAVIGLRYFADLDDAAIAHTLGCTQSTVRVHAARALRTLRIAQTTTSTSAEA